MYNPHFCTVPSYYNTDYAQLQCLGQSLTERTAEGKFQFQKIAPNPNQAVQTEFPFSTELANNLKLTPQSQPQIQPLNNMGKPMTLMPWGEEALSF